MILVVSKGEKMAQILLFILANHMYWHALIEFGYNNDLCHFIFILSATAQSETKQ